MDTIIKVSIYVAIILLLIILLKISDYAHARKHGFYCWHCRKWRPPAPIFADDGALYLRTGCPKCGTMPVAPKNVVAVEKILSIHG